MTTASGKKWWLGELGLGSGPPEPQVPPEPDEWMRRVSTLPLLCQPGERWLYNTGSDLLGVLIARAAGQPLDAFMRERVFEPLGMVDTGFITSEVARLGSCYGVDPATGERSVYDPPHGQWSRPPAFPSAAGGLVSTIDDVHAFGSHVARQRPAARWFATALTGVGRRDDDRSDRRRTRCARAHSRRFARLGLRRQRAGATCRGRGGVSAATAGTVASARRGRTIPTSDSSASSSPPTCSRVPIPSPP